MIKIQICLNLSNYGHVLNAVSTSEGKILGHFWWTAVDWGGLGKHLSLVRGKVAVGGG